MNEHRRPPPASSTWIPLTASKWRTCDRHAARSAELHAGDDVVGGPPAFARTRTCVGTTSASTRSVKSLSCWHDGLGAAPASGFALRYNLVADLTSTPPGPSSTESFWWLWHRLRVDRIVTFFLASLPLVPSRPDAWSQPRRHPESLKSPRLFHSDKTVPEEVQRCVLRRDITVPLFSP